MKRITDKTNFVWQYIRDPKSLGAVAPSSVWLARQMIHEANLTCARNVVEFGPGTGIFTKFILPELHPDCRFLAIERNETMSRIFREHHPDVTLVEGCVSEIEEICRDHGMLEVDRIVSGLPWAAMNGDTQQMILDAVIKVLCPGGFLVTFTYLGAKRLPAGRAFQKRIRKNFKEVSFSDPVWMNFPPARVYTCKV
jgi:phospholipid N-methyltransferase